MNKEYVHEDTQVLLCFLACLLNIFFRENGLKSGENQGKIREFHS